jgi:hypothetical protein
MGGLRRPAYPSEGGMVGYRIDDLQVASASF